MYKGKHASNRVISVILALSPLYTDAKKGKIKSKSPFEYPARV